MVVSSDKFYLGIENKHNLYEASTRGSILATDVDTSRRVWSLQSFSGIQTRCLDVRRLRGLFDPCYGDGGPTANWETNLVRCCWC